MCTDTQNKSQGQVEIDWGHTAGDAGWACNSWISGCGGNCKATPAPSASSTAPTSKWSCINKQGQPIGNIEIWWGHTAGDAAWACDNWISNCGLGGCTTKRIS